MAQQIFDGTTRMLVEPDGSGGHKPCVAADVTVTPKSATWTVYDKAEDAGPATATKAGEAGKSHYITAINAGELGGVTAGGTYQIKDGDTVIWEGVLPWLGSDQSDRGTAEAFAIPLKITAGHAATLYVAATAGVGVANLAGYTE